jgi:hypothetical protein
MDLTPKMAAALVEACERDDGKMFQGWMSDAEWQALEEGGYMEQRQSGTDDERATWVACFEDRIDMAKADLSVGQWEDALRHLRDAEQLAHNIRAEWWFMTDMGRKAVGEGPVVWCCHNGRHLHTTREARNRCTHWGPLISEDARED